MLYIHYCENCDYIHMLSGHRLQCPSCNKELLELQISYTEYMAMDAKKREEVQLQCKNPKEREKLSHPYRKHKFSKWYKEGGNRG